MKRLIAVAFRCSLMFVLSALAYAGSAHWNLNPTSGDWNTAANWTPNEVPNGPADLRLSVFRTPPMSLADGYTGDPCRLQGKGDAVI
jgi:hypothetical protein